jgi:predicted secreted protein
MASQSIPGYKGTLRISTDGGTTFNPIAEIKDVEITIVADMADVTSHDSAGWKEKLPTLNEWTATVGALYIEGDAQQTSVRSAILNKTSLVAEFRPQGAISAKKQYKGTCFVANFKPSSPNTDAALVNVELAGTGALVESAQP